MKFYLILSTMLLLPLNVSLSVHKQKQQEKTKLSDEINCEHDLIPGLSLMEKGIDINSLDFYPMDAGINRENGYKESIFSFSCKNGLTWKNRHDTSNTVFNKPDEVENVSYLSEGELTASAVMLSSMTDTMNSLNTQAGVGGTYEDIGFSASGSFQYATQAIYQSKEVITMAQTQISAYEIEVKENTLFTEKFSNSLKSLPNKYSDNPETYNDFLNRFGTHYFVNARFGGSVILRTNFKQDYVKTQNSLELTQTIKSSFVNVYNSEMSMAEKTKSIDEQFNSSSSSSFYYFGGHPDLVEKASMSQWVETVNLDPWLFSGTLRSIDEIISKQNEYVDKAKEVSIAIKVKLARASLANLEKSMAMFEFVKHSVQDLDVAKEMLEEIENFFEESKKEFELNELNENLNKLKKLLKYANVEPFDCFRFFSYDEEMFNCIRKYSENYQECAVDYYTAICENNLICKNCIPADVISYEKGIREFYKKRYDTLKNDGKCFEDLPFDQPFCSYQPF